MLVLDASAAISWCFADEFDENAEEALKRVAEDGAMVPALFWFELRNALIVSERRGRMSEAQTSQALSFIGKLAITADRNPVESAVMKLARAYGLTVYDAAYLELAQRQILPLATLDVALRRAASLEKVSLVKAG